MKSPVKVQISSCPAHKLLYSHICTHVGCRKLLCLKCLEPHKKLHLHSVRTFLEVSSEISEDIQCFHRNLKLLTDSLAIAIKNYPHAIATKTIESKLKHIKPALDNLGEFIAEIAVQAMEKQNNKIADCAAKFRTLKRKISNHTKVALNALSVLHFNNHRQNLLWKNAEFELPDLARSSHTIYFVDSIQKTYPFTLINDSVVISLNTQVVYFSDTLLLINARRQELFQSTLQSMGAPHSATKFVPRADLKVAIKNAFCLAVLLNSVVYLVGEKNQKYSFFEDEWYYIPDLRMKQGGGISVCLMSDRYLYAFRGTGHGMISAEVLDLLAEDQGWTLKLIKCAPIVKYPIIDKTICFQQDNEGICLFGNTIPPLAKYTSKDEPKSSQTAILYFDKISGRLTNYIEPVSDIKFSAQYSIKDQGNAVNFIEENFSTRKVWTFYKQLKQLSMKFSYIQHY